MWRGFVGWVVALGLAVGCAQSAGSARFVSENISLPDESSQYASEARPDGAWGGPGVQRLQADVEEALRARGVRAQADGALSATASWVLREVHQQRGIDTVSLDAAARHFGFGGVVVAAATFGTASQDLWREQIEGTPRNVQLNRYGIRVSPSGSSAAIVVGSMEASYEPIARTYEPGQSVTFRGQVAPRFARTDVFLTKPDGTVDHLHGATRAFDATFALAVTGQYRLEVMGDGPSGPVVVSNVPLFVGVPEPVARGSSATDVDPEQAEARMFLLLNNARKAAGVRPLLPDAELREIALGHSEDMADNGFFGHVSPTSGTPEDRARRSGVLVAVFGENVANAPTPEAAHQGLMDSPGHRQNMLRPEFTHVGIAATKQGNTLFITMNFGRRPSPAVVPTNAAQLEAALSTLRAAKNLAPAAPDPIYRVAAQAGADAMAKGEDLDGVSDAINEATRREVDRLQSSRSGGCTMTLEILEIEQLKELAPLFHPSLRRIGVGARLREDAKGRRLSSVFLLEGAPCQ